MQSKRTLVLPWGKNRNQRVSRVESRKMSFCYDSNGSGVILRAYVELFMHILSSQAKRRFSPNKASRFCLAAGELEADSIELPTLQPEGRTHVSTIHMFLAYCFL
jgi:hypothetical protein